jgi:hypothetical protein
MYLYPRLWGKAEVSEYTGLARDNEFIMTHFRTATQFLNASMEPVSYLTESSCCSEDTTPGEMMKLIKLIQVKSICQLLPNI